MSAVFVKHRAAITAAGDNGARVGAIQKFAFAADAAQPAVVFIQLFAVPLFDGGEHITLPQIAINVVFFNARAQKVNRRKRKAEQCFFADARHRRGFGEVAARKAVYELPAVSSRCAPADSFAFQ